MKIAFFGHFGMGNFGNESTLHATLYHLRLFFPHTEVRCITTGPDGTTPIRGIAATPISGTAAGRWRTRNRVVKLLRKGFSGIPRELPRWLDALTTARGTF